MLFSPPKEFGNQFLYKLVGIISGVHIELLMLFFLAEIWFGAGPLVFSLKSVGSPISLLPGKPGASATATKTRTQKKVAPQKKRTIVKKKSPVAKKKLAPAKPKPVAKKTDKPKKAPKKEVAPDKVPQKDAKKKTVPQESSVAAEIKEFAVGQGAVAQDSVIRELSRHFTLPLGFDDIESFIVSFDVLEGKVLNISPRGRESLVVYTAVKDALLKSTMPIRNRKNIQILIT